MFQTLLSRVSGFVAAGTSGGELAGCVPWLLLPLWAGLAVWPSPSTKVVEFVLEPEALLNQLVTLVKQVASTVFNLFLKAADLVA